MQGVLKPFRCRTEFGCSEDELFGRGKVAWESATVILLKPQRADEQRSSRS